MQIADVQSQLQRNLSLHIEGLIPHHSISEVYRYALLPPGKLFRPLLCLGSFLNYSGKSVQAALDPHSDVSKVASFLEMHHSYTLVHDDMPCMDDDDERRGKASTHRKFGEWKALLIGDGLLGASWQVLSKINSENLHTIFKYSTWSLGPKGLLQGQVLDLSEEMTESFDKLILTHKLKTARLIQTSLVSGYLLTEKPDYKTSLNLHRLGESLGISFQLLDDLTELTEELGEHEQKVNPWLWAPDDSHQSLLEHLTRVEKYTPLKAEFLRGVLSHYFLTISKKIGSHRDPIISKISDEKLRPVETLLKTLSNS